MNNADKYLAVLRFTDGDLVTISFDSHEEMEEYIEETWPHTEVILTMSYSTEKGNNAVEILSHC